MAAWHPRNDDAPTLTSLNLPCPHRKRTRAATRIQATYRGGQTRDRVVRKALAEFHDICNRISTECSGISAAADPLTFHRPNDLPRCFGVDALAAAAAFAAATAIATPTATATAATATVTTATAAAATAAATAAAATAATATAAAATPAPATAAAATATGDTVTTGTAAVSPPAPRSEDGDDPPAAAAVNGNNENSELRLAVNPLSTSSARNPPPPQAERARNACRAHHGSDGRTGTAGGSREERPADVVVDIGDKEADKEDKEKEELEERAGHRRQHDGGFGGGGGGRGVDGGGGEGDGGGGRRERVGGGEGGECLFTYSDGEEDDEELEDSLAAASSSTGGDGAAGLLPPSLLPTSPASNSANRFVSATAAARDQHHTHHHHHHGSGGGSGDGEQQHKQQGKGGRGEAARDDNGREVGDLVRTPAAASSDRGQERLSRAKDGGVSGVIGMPGGGSRSDRSDVSGLSPRRTSPSPPPVAARVNPSVGGDYYRDEALDFAKDGVVGRVVDKRVLEASGASRVPEMPEPLGGGDGQDKDERGERGRATFGVGRVAVAVELATSLLPSSLSSGVEEGANESDQLPLLLVSDATTSTATATATASATATAAAASYGTPSAVLNDGELYDIGGGSGGLWGSRDGLRMALSSSFASSCETTPLKGEAISAAIITAAAATAAVAVESDYPDATENVMEASGAVAGYWRTPALDGVSYKRNSGGGWGVGEDAAGIARDLTQKWGLLYRDDDERQALEGRGGPRASTVVVTAAVDDSVYLDRERSTKIADASSSELEEELRRIREALANRVRYLQQSRKREEIGGAAERDPYDVARRLLERR